MTKLILLSGDYGVGKSEFGKQIRKHVKFSNIPIIALADNLKYGLSQMLGINIQYFYDPDLKNVILPEYGVTPRYLMETCGTNWGRDMVSVDLWSVVLKRKLQKTNEKFIIVEDVRFQSELRFLSNHYPIHIVYIKSNRENVKSSIGDLSLDYLKNSKLKFNVLTNNSSLPAYREKCYRLMEFIENEQT